MSRKTVSLQIAGIPMLLRAAPEQLFEDDGILSGFRMEPQDGAVVYDLAVENALESAAGALCYSDPGFCVYRNGAEWNIYFGGADSEDPGIYAMARRTAESISITYRRTEYLTRISPKQALRCMELPHMLAVHNGILLHCAWIRWRGKAILFTAPSGTGKSTQARLWCEYMDAELINGDRSAVRICDDRILACGIPMSGSSEVRKNEIMPVGAIVYLSQSPQNRIQRLRGAAAFRRVWEGCTVPSWDREDVSRMTDTVSGILSRVPVYHLACRPDWDAVQLLKENLEVI